MKLRLPAPGVFAAVTLLILSGGLAFTVWWPYHREQAVIQYLETVGTVDVDYEYRGPGILEPYADSERLNWFRRIAQLRIDQSAGGVADVPSLAPLLRCWSERLGKTEMTAFQASARGGVVRVRVDGERVILGGEGVTVMRGELL
jgi:hypothetical protein